MEPIPPEAGPTWTLIEWAISGFAIALTAVLAWAGNLHYTVSRHDKDIESLKLAMKDVATKDDIADLKTDLRRLLDWALGRREPPT